MRLDWQPLTTPAARDAYLADALRGYYVGDARRGPLAGGRAAALERLARYDVSRYGKTRNFTDAPVSRLSADLRHGTLSVTEVRDAVKEKHRGTPEVIEEFLRQLAWRDFFDKVLEYHGTALRHDLEEAKHAVAREDVLPADVAAGRTGLPCVDGMLAELFTSGYLHNHERLWFAAYLCHFRGVAWPRGAELFRRYLLDGDEASNSASWQWVESTFAAKPYFMNKENVAHFSGNRWCGTCTAKCPFDASYETLQTRLFGGNRAPLAKANVPAPPRAVPPPPARSESASADSVLWVHDAMLSPDDAAVRSFPDSAVEFVFDAPALAAEPWAFHRLAFVFDGVCELFATLPNPVKEVHFGDPAAVIAGFRPREVAWTDHADPAVKRMAESLPGVACRWLPRPQLAAYAEEPRRFSRYWQAVAKQVLGYAPKAGPKFHK